MGERHHRHHLPYSPEHLYDLVSDVEKYPEFLPFCLATRVLSRSETEIIADLSVGYKFFRETFRSRVQLTPKSRIDIEYIQGPFQHLQNHWVFQPAEDGGTNIDFFINFKFQSTFFHKASQAVFESMFEKILEAFEERARKST